MPAPLRIGLAGLGTVGAGVVRMLSDAWRDIAARAGRPVEIAAVSARSRHRDRGVDLARLRLGGRSGRAGAARRTSTSSSR